MFLKQGQVKEAETFYRQANIEVTDTRLPGVAAALLQDPPTSDALATLRSDEPDDRFEPLIIKGEAVCVAGDTARRAVAVQCEGGAGRGSGRARLGMGPPQSSSYEHLANRQRAGHELMRGGPRV